MFSVEILLPILVIAAFLVGFILWRSKKEERIARNAGLKLRSATMDDPLTVSASRVEPDLAAEEEKPAEALSQPEPSLPDPDQTRSPADEVPPPSEEPPIYDELEREEARRAEAAARSRTEAENLRDNRDRATPPVDPAVEWVLDIAPVDGMQFALGGVKSLKLELERLDLPLLVRVWAQSSKDSLYYEADELTCPARQVVATLLLANRTAKLDEVSASRFYQVLEQSAAQNSVVIRREFEPEQAVQRSVNLRNFIEFFDRRIEMLIAPREEGETLSADRVSKAALRTGFMYSNDRWELRLDPADRDPVIWLALVEEGESPAKVSLNYELPLANSVRGDLRKFLEVANQLAAELGAVWTDCSGRPIDAGAAMAIAEQVASQDKLMTESGVVPGSPRARLLFSR
ncbi:hypothetical protein [Sutterella sp.]|uniref:hypothetical protein n=1 Tax=Sutterella sp. TaxID=1981025 RepID=UPI0026DF7BA5|nr:hypothetical protein [Sutterella sp.]MDO5531397.1 hypothetical protein [Sutterella sp.]